MEKHKLGHIRYGIKVGQRYAAADGKSKTILKVLDVHTFANCDDVIVHDSVQNLERRIDCFKLAMVRYYLIFEPV
jgi:hypothetical protein